VIERVLQAAPPVVKRSPRQGIYAADDDSLESWVTSFDAGCIASKTGQNRPAQVEYISGAQYRMLRVCNGDVGLTRSMYRLYKTQMQGYNGHAIWMDAPMIVNRGQQPTADHYVLAFKHGIKKALAMGVPFMFSGPQGNQAAQQLGLQVQQMQVTMSIDKGNTGLHQCQGIVGGHYFVAWPSLHGCGYKTVPDEAQLTYDQAYNVSVIMPPK
jgi:hypothetical protein